MRTLWVDERGDRERAADLGLTTRRKNDDEMVLAYVPHNSKIVTDERRPNEPFSAMEVGVIDYALSFFGDLELAFGATEEAGRSGTNLVRGDDVRPLHWGEELPRGCHQCRRALG